MAAWTIHPIHPSPAFYFPDATFSTPFLIFRRTFAVVLSGNTDTVFLLQFSFSWWIWFGIPCTIPTENPKIRRNNTGYLCISCVYACMLLRKSSISALFRTTHAFPSIRHLFIQVFTWFFYIVHWLSIHFLGLHKYILHELRNSSFLVELIFVLGFTHNILFSSIYIISFFFFLYGAFLFNNFHFTFYYFLNSQRVSWSFFY